MHELVPKAKRFAVLINPASAKPAGATAQALREAAPGLGIELLFFKASSAFEIDAAFAAIVDAKAEAVFVVPNGYFREPKAQFDHAACSYSVAQADDAF
jgi:ABC-type uncharacterized transport system substrate-binding protein